MKGIPSKTIVFITGAFVSNSCWNEWKTYFESNGYNTIAEPWPHKDAPAEVLRNRQPDAEIASNRLAALTDYYAEIVKKITRETNTDWSFNRRSYCSAFIAAWIWVRQVSRFIPFRHKAYSRLSFHF